MQFSRNIARQLARQATRTRHTHGAKQFAPLWQCNNGFANRREFSSSRNFSSSAAQTWKLHHTVQVGDRVAPLLNVLEHLKGNPDASIDRAEFEKLAAGVDSAVVDLLYKHFDMFPHDGWRKIMFWKSLSKMIQIESKFMPFTQFSSEINFEN